MVRRNDRCKARSNNNVSNRPFTSRPSHRCRLARSHQSLRRMSGRRYLIVRGQMLRMSESNSITCMGKHLFSAKSHLVGMPVHGTRMMSGVLMSKRLFTFSSVFLILFRRSQPASRATISHMRRQRAPWNWYFTWIPWQQNNTLKAKQEPKNNNNESWVQQMMANKNYQEFVPSSRPISRTASESAPSEIDGECYKDGLLSRLCLRRATVPRQSVHPSRSTPNDHGLQSGAIAICATLSKGNVDLAHSSTTIMKIYIYFYHLVVSTNIPPTVNLSGIQQQSLSNGNKEN